MPLVLLWQSSLDIAFLDFAAALVGRTGRCIGTGVAEIAITIVARVKSCVLEQGLMMFFVREGDDKIGIGLFAIKLIGCNNKFELAVDHLVAPPSVCNHAFGCNFQCVNNVETAVKLFSQLKVGVAKLFFEPHDKLQFELLQLNF